MFALKRAIYSFLFLSLTGCAPVLIGAGVGAVAGYTLSNDSAVGNLRTEYRQLWDLCIEKLESLEAEIVEANESKGIIRAVISENKVTIKIDTITSQTQRLRVSARKYLLPKPHFAQKIFLKITEELR